MRLSALILFCLVGCSSINVGGGYIDRGGTLEVSSKMNDSPFGMRVSVSKIALPSGWKELYGDSTMRYAAGPFAQINVISGFYIEPRIEAAFYPDLGTPFEPEAGFRIGWIYEHLNLYVGVRHPLGNGDRHESFDPPEYEHINDGWKPEVGFTWSFDF